MGFHLCGMANLVRAGDEQLPIRALCLDRFPGLQEKRKPLFRMYPAEKKRTPASTLGTRREIRDVDPVRHDRDWIAQARLSEMLRLHLCCRTQSARLAKMRALERRPCQPLLPGRVAQRPGVQHASWCDDIR